MGFYFVLSPTPPGSIICCTNHGSLRLSILLVIQKNLEVGEVLSVDVSCIVALNTTVNVQIKYNGPMRRAVFGVSCIFLFFFFWGLILFILLRAPPKVVGIYFSLGWIPCFNIQRSLCNRMLCPFIRRPST